MDLTQPQQPARQRLKVDAVASLVVGVLALLSLTSPAGLVLGVIAAGLGHSARWQISRKGGAGAALALAGLVLGTAVPDVHRLDSNQTQPRRPVADVRPLLAQQHRP